jgi:D-alanyl-D-alanine carboxypeptidase
MSFYKVLAKTFLLFTVLALTACTASPPISRTPAVAPKLKLAQKLQNTLDDSLKNSKIQGVSSAIIMPNEQIWFGVSGMSDPTIEEQITPEMLFDIGSTGKNYVAALILQLVEEGRLTLEDPLRKWLPDHPNIDNNITVRQMLNHTSGIYDIVKHSRSPWQMAYKSTKMWTQEQILADLVDKPYFSPGNGWHYSSTNYILLRMIVEKATGLKVSEEIKNRFLTPLNLDGTIIVDPLAPIPPGKIIANNWIGDVVDLATKPQPWTTTSPHLIYATAEDSAKWIHLLYHEKKVLDQKLLDQMLDFHSPTPNEPPLSGYGLGVMFIDFELAEKSFGVKGIRMWGHGGSTLGFRSIVMYLPDYGTTISVMINGNNDESLINIFVGLLKVVVDDLRKTS